MNRALNGVWSVVHRNCTTPTDRGHKTICTARCVPSRLTDDRGELKGALSSSELLGVSMNPESGGTISPPTLRSQISAFFHRIQQTEHLAVILQLKADCTLAPHPAEMVSEFCAESSSSAHERVIVQWKTPMVGRPVRREVGRPRATSNARKLSSVRAARRSSWRPASRASTP